MRDFQRERYIKYLTYTFVNIFFWIIMLVLLFVELFISIFWIHNFVLFIISLLEVIIVFGIQKLLQKKWRKRYDNIKYKNIIINSSQVKIATLNFKVVNLFVIVSFSLWIGTILYMSLNLNEIILLTIVGATFVSMLTVLGIIISSIYYSIKK